MFRVKQCEFIAARGDVNSTASLPIKGNFVTRLINEENLQQQLNHTNDPLIVGSSTLS